MKRVSRLTLGLMLMIVAGFVFLVVNQSFAACPDGIVSYWKLDGNSGSPYPDFIGNNDAVTGTGLNDPTPAPSVGINGAEQFVATDNDGLDVPANHDFNWTGTDSFSIELWVKTDGAVTPGDKQVLIGRDGGSTGMQWWIGLDQTTGNASFYFADGTNVADGIGIGASLTDGNWHHVVFVRNHDEATSTDDNILYVDGAATAATTISKAFPDGFGSNDASVNIGYLNSGGGYHFNGFLDEVAVYNRALTASEIDEHFAADTDYCGGSNPPSDAPYPDNTISLWHLDGTSGSPYKDAVGNNDAVTGTGTNDPTPAPTVGINGAEQFVATDSDGLDVPATYDYNWTGAESFSIELWVKTDGAVTPGDKQVLIGRDGGSTGMQWWIGLDQTTGKASFYFTDGTDIADGIGVGASLTDGNWHHVVFVRNHDEATSTDDNILYVDGAATAATTVSQPFTKGFGSNDAGLNIGYLNNSSDKYYFDGFLDEVAIYGRALPQSEIQAHYNAGLNGDPVQSLRPEPAANAGADQTVTVADKVTLDGSGSTDSDGTIVGYQWEQISGTTVTLTGADTAKATFTAPSAATTLTFKLTVTDNDGQSSSDQTTVTVKSDSSTPSNPTTPTSSDGGGGGGGCFISTLF